MKSEIRRKSVRFLAVLGLLIFLIFPAIGQGPVVNFVSVGGHDTIIPWFPNRDASFSLVAKTFSDGTVQGQWSDRFATPFNPDGYHAAVNCVSVNGNQAWVSGIVTTSGDPFYVGAFVIVRVSDNGTSRKDPLDQFSFPLFGFHPAYNDCHAQYGDDLMPLWDMPDGQVIVR